MLDTAIRINQFLLQYGRLLVGDIAADRFTEQPSDGINHPAWILGHLALTADSGLDVLGVPRTLPREWAAIFGPGSKPSASGDAYPSKDELVRAFEQTYEQLRQKAATATAEQLARPTTIARAREALPTTREMVAFLLTGHMGVHLGQLSMWRRLIGLPPLF